MEKQYKYQKKWQKGFAFIPFLVWTLATLFVGTTIIKSGVIKIGPNGNLLGATVRSSSPLPVDTSSLIMPSSFPTSTQIPVNNQQETQTVYVDPDPVIDCNVSGTLTVKIKKSECAKSFACQIDNKWYVYTDRSKCTADQNDYWQQYYKDLENNQAGQQNNSNNQNYPQSSYYNCSTVIGNESILATSPDQFSTLCAETQQNAKDIQARTDASNANLKAVNYALTHPNLPPYPSIPPIVVPSPSQMIQNTIEAFDTGMMCERKATYGASGGLIFMGGCI